MKLILLSAGLCFLLLIGATAAQDSSNSSSDDQPASPYAAVNLERELFGEAGDPKSWRSFPVCKRNMLLQNGTKLYPWELRQSGNNLSEVVKKSSLNVAIGLYIDSVLAVDEHDLWMIVRAKVHLAWADCRLSWDPNDYDGINRVEVPRFAEVFFPKLILQESYDQTIDLSEMASAFVESRGIVVAQIPQVQLQTSCQFQLGLYPFDTQACNISIISPFYDLRYINLSLWSETFPQKAWQDEDMDSHTWVHKNVSHTHDLVSGLYSKLTTVLVIERLPLFHLFNLVLPCTLLIFLCCTIFALPNSGDGDDTKINMSVTILLSVVVFMLILYDRLPPTGTYVALLNMYFAGCIILCALSCLCAVLVCLVDSFSEVEDVFFAPSCLHKFLFHHVGPVLLYYRFRYLHAVGADKSLCEEHENEANKPPLQHGNGVGENEKMELLVVSEGAAKNGSSTISKLHKHRLECCPFIGMADLSEWKLIAEIFDRMLFVLFLSGAFLFEVVFFSIA